MCSQPAQTSEHERDALISAVAARKGFEGGWTRDLIERRYPSEQDPSESWLGPVNYFWPPRNHELPHRRHLHDSLDKLTGDEQKAAKTTAFDLQMNPAHPGLNFHKINASKDHNFRSVRVSRDLRLIVHQTRDNLLLCYVGHHDDAYRWAERRKIETHPKTGAAQLVEVRERVQEIRYHATSRKSRSRYRNHSCSSGCPRKSS